jgi:hypothetical protein
MITQSGEFPRLFVPHLVSMQPLQSEVEVVCSVQSHLEAKIGWILFAESVEISGSNKTGKFLSENDLISIAIQIKAHRIL